MPRRGIMCLHGGDCSWYRLFFRYQETIRNRERSGDAVSVERGFSDGGDDRGFVSCLPRVGKPCHFPRRYAPAGAREAGLRGRSLCVHRLVLYCLPKGGTGYGESVSGHHEAGEAPVHRYAHPCRIHEFHPLQPEFSCSREGKIPRDSESAPSVGGEDERTHSGGCPESRSHVGSHLPAAELFGRERGGSIFPVCGAGLPRGGDPCDGGVQPEEEKKIIGSVLFGGASKSYDPNTGKHHHLICLRCRRIIDFSSNQFDRIEVPSSAMERFTVVRTTVHVEGICDECQGRNRA